MEYNFRSIEQKWQAKWKADGTYTVSNDSPKPKYYVLDMFPYPSGSGLHVGHPLGYIASDIFARYKRLKGFNVLHPMGYDAFGLPAEQYALEHGVHPAHSTARNIDTFRKQLDKIGFCYDWSRQVNTSEPQYYKWTQWIFLKLFGSWYNRSTKKTEPLETLVHLFVQEGNAAHPVPDAQYAIPGRTSGEFSAADWVSFPEKIQQEILMQYRVAYCGYGEVNWCEALGTVLANDEVVNGVSERGGFPVVRKRLRQWYLRITEYADRLLQGLQTVEFSDAMKEMQSNWIGKSSGAEISFVIENPSAPEGFGKSLTVYTTRPETIFGVDFIVVAPEHELVQILSSNEQRAAVDEYKMYVKSRSERERMAEKKISGVFTGSFAIHPFTGARIPVWLSEYVLAGYGTGAIMAVPSGDERDHKFAQHFHLPITNIIGSDYNGTEANPTKDAVLQNSGFLDGLVMRRAMDVAIEALEKNGVGRRKVNYKMRDAAFSRQRYWGEPFPVKWIDGIAYPLPEHELPLELAYVESYKPGPDGEGPLANIASWTSQHLETNTMPGYAGSSWYFLRYMDPGNDEIFCSRSASDYWNQVDLYVGGTEHAVGHLLYSRMWTKALYDLGYISFQEPFKKLLNQGMITSIGFYCRMVEFEDADGARSFMYGNENDLRTNGVLHNAKGAKMIDADNSEKLVRLPYAGEFIDASNRMTRAAYRSYIDKYAVYNTPPEDEFVWIASDADPAADYFTVDLVNEKMSKSKYNTYNPDTLVERYGADTFRMYEMFLGPVEMSKPWDTKGIEGVSRFLRKLWKLYFDEKGLVVTNATPTAEEYKVLHRTIKKVEEDTERFSYNTVVSAFMVCCNELADLQCNRKDILQPLAILLAPYAPHVSEELWQQTGGEGSVLDATFPVFDATFLVEQSKEYPVSVNGKLRTQMVIDLGATQEEVERLVLANPVVEKWTEGKPPKKLIYVKGKMINVVI